MIKAHKIRLNPTKEQSEYFFRCSGIARLCFNWGLAEYNRRLDWNSVFKEFNEANEYSVKIKRIPVNGRLLKKEFNIIKAEQFPYVSEVTTWAMQGAFDDLQSSFRMFFDKHKKGLLPKAKKPRKDGKPNGWPRFKSRHRATPAFYLANQSLKFDEHNVKIPKCPDTWVNMTEALRFQGKVMAGRVSFSGGYWWLSVQVDIDYTPPEALPDTVGVDLGIKYLAVTSDGQVFNNPKPLVKAQKKLRKLQRKLDRQRRANNPSNYKEDGTAKRGVSWVYSNNMKETELKVTRLHQRIANIRADASHKMTSDIATSYGVIGVEDLNVKGMMANRKLSKALADASLFEKRRQLTYKAQWNGGEVVPVDRWFPSSKTCNECGWINTELTLSDRHWVCPECNTRHDRDGNAAKNIRDEAIRILTNE